MKLSTTFLIVFCLHIYWVCGDSTTIPSQSTVKSSVAVETNPAIVVERSDVGRNNESNVATSKLLEQKGEQEPVSKIGDESIESNESNEGGTDPPVPYEARRGVRSLNEKPILVGGLSGCKCFCPHSQSYASAAVPSYLPPVYPASPAYLPTKYHSSLPILPKLPQYSLPHYPLAPTYAPIPNYSPQQNYLPAAAYPAVPSPYARNAPENDDNLLHDSMAASSRSAYAYPNPNPVPPVPVSQTYPSPAPSVKCGQNLLVGCAPTVTNVPCSAYSGSY